MALLRFESFDHYDTATASAAITDLGPNCTIATVGRNGTQGVAVRGSQSTTLVQLQSSPSGNTGIVGFAVRMPTALPAQDRRLCSFQEGSQEHITLILTTTGALVVRRGASTILGTSGATLATATYYFLEFKVLISDTVGTYEVRIDGTNVLSASAVDTRNAGTTGNWTSVPLTGGAGSVSSDVDLDDVYICDGTGAAPFNTFLGDRRVVSLLPEAGNGTISEWDPSTGTDRGTLVRENPPDQTTLISSGDVGERNTLNFPPVSVVGTISAIQVKLYSKATTASARSLAATARIAGVNYDHPIPQTLGSDWTFYRFVWLTNPATGLAWTVADIDAAEFGAKVAA